MIPSLRLLLSVTLGALALVPLAHANGQIDTSFGSESDGRIAFAIPWRDPVETPGVLAWAQMSPFKILPRGDGSMIVLSNIATPYDLPISAPTVPVAVRIDRDGVWDPAWGASGGGRSVIYVGEDYNWNANDAVLLGDGGIAIVGTIWNPDGSSDMAVWKLRADGAVDTTFGVNGLRHLRRYGSMPSDAGKAIAPVDVDIVGNGIRLPFLAIAGNVRDGLSGNHTLGVILLTEDGYLCPIALGGCGSVAGGTNPVDGEWGMLRVDTGLCPNNATIDVADIIGFPAGVGTAIPIAIRGCGDTGVVKHTRIGNTATGWRWTVNTGYANQGRSLIFFAAGLMVEVNSLVHAPTSGALGNESMALAGFVANADRSFPNILAARITRDTIDTATYGMQAAGSPWMSPGVYADLITAQPDGRLIVGGGFALSSWTTGDAMLMRLMPDLSPDPAFGNFSASTPGRMAYGYSIAGTDRDNRANAMALTQDGKLVFAGYVHASNDGQSRYGSVMRVLLQSDRIFSNGFDLSLQ